MLNAARFFVCWIIGGFSNEIKTFGRLGRDSTVPRCGRMQEESGGGATSSSASIRYDSFKYAHQEHDARTTSDPH